MGLREGISDALTAHMGAQEGQIQHPSYEVPAPRARKRETGQGDGMPEPAHTAAIYGCGAKEAWCGLECISVYNRVTSTRTGFLDLVVLNTYSIHSPYSLPAHSLVKQHMHRRCPKAASAAWP